MVRSGTKTETKSEDSGKQAWGGPIFVFFLRRGENKKEKSLVLQRVMRSLVLSPASAGPVGENWGESVDSFMTVYQAFACVNALPDEVVGNRRAKPPVDSARFLPSPRKYSIHSSNYVYDSAVGCARFRVIFVH